MNCRRHHKPFQQIGPRKAPHHKAPSHKAQSTARFLLIAGGFFFICILILLGIGGIFFIPVSRDVYVVNGLDESYKVSVDGGSPVSIAPGGSRLFEISSADFTVSVDSDRYEIEDVQGKVNTRLWKKLIDPETVVINPDGAAILLHSRIPYISDDVKPEDYPPGESSYYAGEQVHTMDQIDFPFSQEPDEIDLDGYENISWRTVLIIDRITPNSYWNYFADEDDSEAVARAMLNHLKHEDNWGVVSGALELNLEDEEFQKLLEERLDRYPIEVQVHRDWQAKMYAEDRGGEVRDYYERLYKQYPEDKDALYLAGTVQAKWQDGLQYFRQAIAEPDPSYWAIESLGKDALYNGRFQEARNYFDAFVKTAPEKDQWMGKSNDYYLKFALGEYETIRKESNDYVMTNGVDESTELDEIAALAMMGRWSEIRTRRAEILQELRDYDYEESYVQEHGYWIDSYVYQLLGRHDEALDAYEKYLGSEIEDEHNHAKFLKLLKALKPVEAFTAYYATEVDAIDMEEIYLSFEDAMLIATISRRVGDSENEDRFRNLAIELIEAMSYTDQEKKPMVDWLGGDMSVTPEEMMALPIYPYQKVPFLFYVGEVYPAYRERAWTLAMSLKVIPQSSERSVYFPLMGYSGPLIAAENLPVDGY